MTMIYKEQYSQGLHKVIFNCYHHDATGWRYRYDLYLNQYSSPPAQ
jgi:hypothetical protein